MNMQISMEDKQKQRLSDRVLEQIDHEGIAPKPAWHFLLREWVVWLIAGVALVVGSVATALTLYIHDASRFIEHQIHVSDLAAIFHAIPLFWLALVALALFYTVHAVRETRRGYRYNPGWLVGFALGVSIAIGASAHSAGVSESIDRYLIEEVPAYRPLTGFAPKHWERPQAGVVAGVVEAVEEEVITVRKIDGGSIEVEIKPETTVVGAQTIREGARVRVVGTSTRRDGASAEAERMEQEQHQAQVTFEAHEVAPFKGRGGMRMPHRLDEQHNEPVSLKDVPASNESASQSGQGGGKRN